MLLQLFIYSSDCGMLRVQAHRWRGMPEVSTAFTGAHSGSTGNDVVLNGRELPVGCIRKTCYVMR